MRPFSTRLLQHVKGAVFRALIHQALLSDDEDPDEHVMLQVVRPDTLARNGVRPYRCQSMSVASPDSWLP